MATNYTVTFWIGAGINAGDNTAYTSTWIQSGSNAASANGLTLPTNLTSSATVDLVIRSPIDGTTNEGYLYKYPAANTATSDFYLCDSNGANEVFIERISSTTALYSRTSPKTVDLRPLAGKKLYIKNKLITSSPKICMRGDFRLTISYDTWGACTAPTSVSASRSRTTFTVSWSGASGGTNNPIKNYKLLVNTTASETGAWELGASPATSSPVTTQPGTDGQAHTYYFGVRSQATYNNSAYKWSGACSLPAKPSVTAGNVITDTDMDNLRTWIGTSGITDIGDGGIVYASHGNTYRSGLTAGTSKVEASWYNAAATG